MREQLVKFSLGLPGTVIGMAMAYFRIQDEIAASMAHRGWVDSTGMDSYYAIYGLIGYMVSLLAGHALFKFLRK